MDFSEGSSPKAKGIDPDAIGRAPEGTLRDAYRAVPGADEGRYEDPYIHSGIGKKSATNFLAELGGDIPLYGSYKQVIAMAWIDPPVHESGKYEGLSKISKRGNRHLRRIIWLMAVKVIQFNSYFRIYFQKRMEEGLIYKKAVLATAPRTVHRTRLF